MDTFELGIEVFSGNTRVERLVEDMLNETMKLWFICPTMHSGKDLFSFMKC